MSNSMNANDVMVPFAQVLSNLCQAVKLSTAVCQKCIAGLTSNASSAGSAIIAACVTGDYSTAAAVVLNYKGSAAATAYAVNFIDNASYNPNDYVTPSSPPSPTPSPSSSLGLVSRQLMAFNLELRPCMSSCSPNGTAMSNIDFNKLSAGTYVYKTLL